MTTHLPSFPICVATRPEALDPQFAPSEPDRQRCVRCSKHLNTFATNVTPLQAARGCTSWHSHAEPQNVLRLPACSTSTSCLCRLAPHPPGRVATHRVTLVRRTAHAASAHTHSVGLSVRRKSPLPLCHNNALDIRRYRTPLSAGRSSGTPM